MSATLRKKVHGGNQEGREPGTVMPTSKEVKSKCPAQDGFCGADRTKRWGIVLGQLVEAVTRSKTYQKGSNALRHEPKVEALHGLKKNQKHDGTTSVKKKRGSKGYHTIS